MAQQIFLSHDSRDAKLAQVIAETVSRISLAQIEVWFSSDASANGGLKPGQVWVSEIQSRIVESNVILVLLTPNSLGSSWLYFESGYGFSNRECQVVPLCLGIKTSDVPPPLRMFQCYCLNDLESFSNFCRKFFGQLLVRFDEEMASPILRCALGTLESMTTKAVAPAGRRHDSTCGACGRLEICLEMLRVMYDQLPMPVHSINETGVICYVNNKWLEVFGYEREEVVGKPADFLMTAESAELAMLVVIPEFWEYGFCPNIFYQYKKKDGSLVDVMLNCVATTDENGARSSISFVQVISNQRALRQLRKQSGARYESRLRDKSAGFYEMDLFGNFTAANLNLTRLLGFTKKEEVVGKNFRDVVDPESAKSIFKTYHFMFTNRIAKKNYVLKFVRRDGRAVTVKSMVSLITLPSGKATGFRGVVQEVIEDARAIG